MNAGSPCLRPLPAARRVKTLPLSGRGDRFVLVKRVVALIGEGVSKADLVAKLAAGQPPWNERDVEHCLRGIRTGLQVSEHRGGRIRLTDSGRALLQTDDPDALREWMLTGLLGFDHLLVWMSAAPRPKQWLFDELRGVNRGWTTNTYPRSLVNWTLWLGLASKTAASFTLTERGMAWRSLIHWNPEPLKLACPPST